MLFYTLPFEKGMKLYESKIDFPFEIPLFLQVAS